MRDYSEIRDGPSFKNEIINVMFFFPYVFWNKNCEMPEDTKLYGTSKKSYELLREFFFEVEGALQKKYKGRQLNYIISPKFAALDRDKIATIQKLSESKVLTSKMVSERNLDEILNRITPKRGIFIKCRYGAEGKGITLLQKDKWVTNYKVEGNRLTNYGVYDRWEFSEITSRRDLLEQLLEQEVIVEEEIIVPELFADKKFDCRAYVIKGRVPHFFVRVNEQSKVVTNYAQGGKVFHHPETGLSSKFKIKIEEEAVKSAEAFEFKFLGVDIMFDRSEGAKVIEIQTFTDFPDINHFNLAKYMVSDKSGLFC
ncbi:hypothetical protein HZC32_00285 [Candidatus Woesearchaeota archaeon]|nr:hypothetical protein [Candidatus Woesearchaeota archaeon]